MFKGNKHLMIYKYYGFHRVELHGFSKNRNQIPKIYFVTINNFFKSTIKMGCTFDLKSFNFERYMNGSNQENENNS